MTRAGEFIAFVGLALLLHIGFWLGTARTGSEAAGAGGDAAISLKAASGNIVDLVAAWDSPVDAMQTPVAMPVDPAVTVPEAAQPHTAPAVSNSPPKLPQPPAPVRAQAPETVPQVDRTTTRPAILKAAPRVSLRPKAKPDKPVPRVKTRSTKAKPKTAKRKPAPQSSGSQAQAAAGNQNGENAGNRSSQRPATLSRAAKQTLMAKWGASIRNRVERSKRYPSGTRASGTTVLRLTISRSGQLMAVTVARSSGTGTLDKAAVQAVRRARFPAAPKGLSETQYKFNLPLAFTRS